MRSRYSAPQSLVVKKRFGLERMVGVRKQVESRGLVVEPFGIRHLRNKLAWDLASRNHVGFLVLCGKTDAARKILKTRICA
jgi:hypothetical protein